MTNNISIQVRSKTGKFGNFIYAFILAGYFMFSGACGSNDKQENRSNRFVAFRPVSTSARMPDAIFNYIHAAVDTMQKYSIYKDSVNWTMLRKRAIANARGAQTYSETYYAIEEALKDLGDHHSFLKSPAEHQQWLKMRSSDSFRFKRPHGQIITNRIAHFDVPRFASGNPEECMEYATAMQDVIKKLDEKNPTGWIVHLQSNSGGNMWPMLAGIGPLLSREGTQGYFLDANGRSTPWIYENGIAKSGEEVMLKISNPYKVKNKDVPVAVSINQQTASSGEAILISLMGQQNVKVFGTPTAGASTANEEYALKDGARLILTSAVFTDFRGKKYGKRIPPDVDLSGTFFYLIRYRIKEPVKWILKMRKKAG
jgi:carboxyl-terminal processing protease